jgi:hypothetical protein
MGINQYYRTINGEFLSLDSTVCTAILYDFNPGIKVRIIKGK